MFGDTLKMLRKSKGLTQQELASVIGVEQSSIGKYEGKDKKIPSDAVKERIADYFGVSIDFLMGRETNTSSPNIKLDDEALEIVLIYKSLNSNGKKTAKTIMMALSNFKDTTDETEERIVKDV